MLPSDGVSLQHDRRKASRKGHVARACHYECNKASPTLEKGTIAGALQSKNTEKSKTLRWQQFVKASPTFGEFGEGLTANMIPSGFGKWSKIQKIITLAR